MVWDVLLILVGIWIVELLAFLILLLVFLIRHDPPGWWVRRQIPDVVPPEWSGGDRTQTNPVARPRS